MDEFKIRMFEESHAEISNIPIRLLSNEETTNVLRKLEKSFSVTGPGSYVAMIKSLHEFSSPIFSGDVFEDSFSLKSVLTGKIGYVPSSVLIAWGAKPLVDEIELSFFDKHFSDFVFPSSDDIEIFDFSASWVAFITHYGAFSLAMKPDQTTS